MVRGTSFYFPLFKFIVYLTLSVYFSCWLSTENGLIWSFIGPIALVLFVGFIDAEMIKSFKLTKQTLTIQIILTNTDLFDDLNFVTFNRLNQKQTESNLLLIK